YVLSDHDPAIPTKHKKIEQRGRHTLWEVDTTGYLEVIDTSGSIQTTRATLGHDMTPFMNADGKHRTVFPTVAYEGDPAARPTLTGKAPKSLPGHVEKQFAHITDGDFGGTVVAKRRSVVLL